MKSATQFRLNKLLFNAITGKEMDDAIEEIVSKDIIDIYDNLSDNSIGNDNIDGNNDLEDHKSVLDQSDDYIEPAITSNSCNTDIDNLTECQIGENSEEPDYSIDDAMLDFYYVSVDQISQSKKDLNEKIYKVCYSYNLLYSKGSNVSVIEYTKSFLKLYIENKFNHKQIENILKLNSTIFPSPFNGPSSWYTFQQILLEQTYKVI